MTSTRWDETWHRLLEWTSGQGPSERLAAQILISDGFQSLDPSHPLGGKDGGKDALATKLGDRWAMAVYFPRGHQKFATIEKKFRSDFASAKKASIAGFAFVTNQELKLWQRRKLEEFGKGLKIDLYHLERITTILDTPQMASVRQQFLHIPDPGADPNAQLLQDVLAQQKRNEGLQTGGDSFCYFMLYHFDLEGAIARNIVVIRKGEFPLYDVRLRLCDMDLAKDIFRRDLGELNSAADCLPGTWQLKPKNYYRVFFHARNGAWHQDLILQQSTRANCWLAATRVVGRNGRDILFEYADNEYMIEFGGPVWRS